MSNIINQMLDYTIAIDFDGTIHDINHPLPGKKMGPPIQDAKETINRWRIKGHKIIIHSCRGTQGNIIADWMKYYGIMYNEIVDKKPLADFYLDDKGLRFTSWQQADLDIRTYGQ